MKKVYIVGKVTGEPLQECRKKFAQIELRLKEMGMIPINPMNFVSADTDWNTAMKICIGQLLTCDFIYLLPDWKQSRGARIERILAKLLQIEILSIAEGNAI